MNSLRFNAINNLTNNAKEVNVAATARITAVFNENVFTLKTARHYLSEEAYKSLSASVKTGKRIVPKPKPEKKVAKDPIKQTTTILISLSIFLIFVKNIKND